jgi:hypothetical protein
MGRNGAQRTPRPSRHCLDLTRGGGSGLVSPCNFRLFLLSTACRGLHSVGRFCSDKSMTTMSHIAQCSTVRRPAYGHQSPCSAPWTRVIWRAFFPRSNKMDWRMQARRFWLHEQLCVDRENPRRIFVPACLLAETVCVIPHPQRWANMKGFSLVLRR